MMVKIGEDLHGLQTKCVLHGSDLNIAVTFFRLTNWRTRRSRICTQRSTNSERSAISWTLKACFAMNTWREWSSAHHSCLKKLRMESCRAQRNWVIAFQRLMLSAQGFENRSSSVSWLPGISVVPVLFQNHICTLLGFIWAQRVLQVNIALFMHYKVALSSATGWTDKRYIHL